MKKLQLSLTVLLMCVFVAPTFAGDTKLGGIRAGWHRSDIFIDGNGTDYPHQSFYIGFYKNNKIAPIVNWTSGIEYFQNGFKTNSDTYRILHTISIPLALKLKLGPAFVLGGAGANFKVSEDSKLGGLDLGNDAEFFDVPVFVGAGLSILMFSIEARYHWGMLDVYEGGDRNQYFQLGVGVEL